jgi:hypothetical protein
LMPLTIQRRKCMYGVGNTGNLFDIPILRNQTREPLVAADNLFSNFASDW